MTIRSDRRFAAVSVAALAVAGALLAGSGASAAPSVATASTALAAPSVKAPGPNVETDPPAKPGGSSVTVQGPCDGGTVTLKGYRHGKGVAMTATLRRIHHKKWAVRTFVPPADTSDLDGGAAGFTVRHAHGRLVVHGTNLTGSEAVRGYRRAWPQSVAVYASSLDRSRRASANCDSDVYLSAGHAVASAGSLLQIDDLDRRKGTLKILDGNLPHGGVWKVHVAIRDAQGVQRRTSEVTVHKSLYGGLVVRALKTTLTGLPRLRHFTSVRLSVTRNGKGPWLTLERTP
jgi:hypothetical protein